MIDQFFFSVLLTQSVHIPQRKNQLSIVFCGFGKKLERKLQILISTTKSEAGAVLSNVLKILPI